VRVLSHELLSGHPFAGGVEAPLILDRLAAAVPDALVLIVVREQTDSILSNYAQYIRGGGGAALRHVLYGLPGASGPVPWFRLEFFEYDRLVTAYQERFGDDRVLVATFEELQADSTRFFERILRFVGLDADTELHAAGGERVNAKLSGVTLFLKRFVNRVAVVNRYSPGPLVGITAAQHGSLAVALQLDRVLGRLPADPVERRWRRAIVHAVGDRFGPSNTRLAALTGLPLGDLGYSLG
jgi:hypothetical protein